MADEREVTEVETIAPSSELEGSISHWMEYMLGTYSGEYLVEPLERKGALGEEGENRKVKVTSNSITIDNPGLGIRFGFRGCEFKNNSYIEDSGNSFLRWKRITDENQEVVFETVKAMHLGIFVGDELKNLEQVREWIQIIPNVKDEMGNYEYELNGELVKIENHGGMGLYFQTQNWNDGEVQEVKNHFDILMFLHIASKLKSNNSNL